MKDDEENAPIWEPEDCAECGCEAGEFEDSDFVGGAWQCPECGCVQ